MFPDSGGSGGGGMNGSERSCEPLSTAPVQVKPDSFYKKPQQTAVRELLAMRKVAGTGPAKPGRNSRRIEGQVAIITRPKTTISHWSACERCSVSAPPYFTSCLMVHGGSWNGIRTLGPRRMPSTRVLPAARKAQLKRRTRRLLQMRRKPMRHPLPNSIRATEDYALGGPLTAVGDRYLWTGCISRRKGRW